MTQRKSGKGLNFEALRLAIEQCDPDLVLGFYAEDAHLSIANAGFPQNAPFELRGKAEIAKHLRATFGQETSRRVEGEVVGEERVTFREVCEYPDGSRVMVETKLEVHGGKIVSQVEVVAKDSQANREEEIGQRPPTRNLHSLLHPGADASLPDRLLRSKQATEKEDLR
jgi:SnoaL-like protein